MKPTTCGDCASFGTDDGCRDADVGGCPDYHAADAPAAEPDAATDGMPGALPPGPKDYSRRSAIGALISREGCDCDHDCEELADHDCEPGKAEQEWVALHAHATRLQAEVGQLNECIAQWHRDCDEAWGIAHADTNATRILGDKLERETKRADQAEAEATDLQRIITVWRGRHDEDHDRADKAEAERDAAVKQAADADARRDILSMAFAKSDREAALRGCSTTGWFRLSLQGLASKAGLDLLAIRHSMPGPVVDGSIPSPAFDAFYPGRDHELAEARRLRVEYDDSRTVHCPECGEELSAPTITQVEESCVELGARVIAAEAEVERLRGWVARICEELYPVGRYADVSLGMALTGIVNLRHRADKAEAERDDMKRRLCAEMALRLQGGAVPHATPHSVAHGQFGLVEADRLFPRQAQEGGE